MVQLRPLKLTEAVLLGLVAEDGHQQQAAIAILVRQAGLVAVDHRPLLAEAVAEAGAVVEVDQMTTAAA